MSGKSFKTQLTCLACWFLGLFNVYGCGDNSRLDRMTNERHKMVSEQLEKRGISDPAVLKAMLNVPRHIFVPHNQQNRAYDDSPLLIGSNQTISQPYIVALMTELLRLKRSDRVLEIGTGSGYQAAILSVLVDTLYTIEIIEELARRSDSTLKEAGFNNVVVRFGDGFIGWPELAPFDAIIVTCGAPDIPAPLLDQLADGGRMVIPIGTSIQELLLIKKTNGRIDTKKITPVRFVPMTGDSIDKNEN